MHENSPIKCIGPLVNRTVPLQWCSTYNFVSCLDTSERNRNITHYAAIAVLCVCGAYDFNTVKRLHASLKVTLSTWLISNCVRHIHNPSKYHYVFLHEEGLICYIGNIVSANKFLVEWLSVPNRVLIVKISQEEFYKWCWRLHVKMYDVLSAQKVIGDWKIYHCDLWRQWCLHLRDTWSDISLEVVNPTGK